MQDRVPCEGCPVFFDNVERLMGRSRSAAGCSRPFPNSANSFFKSAVIKSSLNLCFTFALSLVATQSLAQSDPLPSWNDGSTKQAILRFVKTTTDQSSPNFVPPAERIVTFDQDGTLWVEHPMYSQVVYCLSRVPAVVKAKPELANVEPFKTVMSGDHAAMAKLSMDDLFKILAATLTGISVDDFRAEAKRWLETAKHPRWNRL